MLTTLFEEIRTEDSTVRLAEVVKLFEECKLLYLCYDLKPEQLLDVLKDNAHQFNDRLTLP